MERKERVKQSRIRFAEKAAARWREREPLRSGAQVRYAEGGPRNADTPSRSAQFVGREELRRVRNLEAAAAGYVVAKERQIGPTLDFTSYPPDEEARGAGRPVARIVELPQPGILPDGFGTGFLVSPTLLLTNHHVLPTLAEARGVGANFLHEHRSSGLNRGPIFALEPDTFYLSDPDLDFALVAVRPVGDDGTSLSAFRSLPLIATTGKILVGHPVSIIQHPNGGPKQYATTQNKLLDVLETGFVHYSTDTMPGSSGSPAFNVHWELIALHHSGVPMMQNGRILRRDGTPWDASMSDDDIQWVANEGVRVSGIVQHLAAVQLPDADQARLLQGLLLRSQDPLEGEVVSPASPRAAVVAREVATSGITINVAGHAYMTFAAAPAPVPAALLLQATNGSGAAAPAPVAEKKLRFDPDYKKRKGYDDKFLGDQIPAPTVTTELNGRMMKPLHYHHFTIVMNKARRLAHWSAVNVDYTPSLKGTMSRKDFGTDTWVPDPRIPSEQQIQDPDFYKPATKIDRGHVVRREDNAWGEDDLEVEYANSDTFHWTNCTPQHERFNQERLSGLWGQLEAHITKEIHAVGNRANIFAGPVLDGDDPEQDYGYGIIQYPLKFWKVIAGVSEDDGQLVAYGFVLDQSAQVKRYGIEGMNVGKFSRNQVALTEIASMTGVVFPKELLDADVLKSDNGERVSIEVRDLSDVRIRGGVALKK